MALATLNYRKNARVSQLLAVDLADSFLNGLIYTPLNAGTYYDAVVKVQGQDSAPTVNREQILGLTRSVYWTPPRSGVGGVLNNRGILAMDIAAATPTMSATPVDTYAVNTLLASMSKNPGAYSSWANANPFTSGSFAGYYRASFGAALAQTWSSDVYTSQESTLIALNNNAGATVLGIMIGAVLDPLDTASAAAESDGRVYSYAVSGGTAAIHPDYLISSSLTGGGGTLFLSHDAAVNAEHHTMFTPGAGTLITMSPATEYVCNTASFDLVMTGLGGKVMGHFGLPFARVTAPVRFLGAGRQLGVTSRYPAGTVLQNGGIDTAYVVFSDSWSANGASLIAAA